MNILSNIDVLTFILNETNEIFHIPSAKIPYIDLTFLISGNMEYFYNGKKVELKSGDAIFYPANSTRMRPHLNSYAHYASFNIKLKEDFSPEISGHITNCVTSEIIYILNLAKNHWANALNKKDDMLASLFLYLYSSLVEAKEIKEKPQINEIKKYIRDHLNEKITLNDISNKVYLAPQYLSALFHKEVGITISEYIISQRIELAKQKIITKNTSILDISENIGFNNYNYFSRTFKKVTGMSPVEFKKNITGIK